MTLREIVKQTFNVDLPIKGGIGNSIENSVIIERTTPLNDYVSVEYEVLKYIGLGREITWEVVKQELIINNNRKIDKLLVKVQGQKENNLGEQLVNYYFDITECFDNDSLNEKSEDVKRLAKLKSFAAKMKEMSDKNEIKK